MMNILKTKVNCLKSVKNRLQSVSSGSNNDIRRPPADVPHVSCCVHRQHSISDSDPMERRLFLVSEVRVRDPELFPAAVVESDQGLVVNRPEC